MIDISADGYDMNANSDNLFATSGPDELYITRKSENTFVIYFDNVALAHRAVERGYINVNGQKIELPDEVKDKIIKNSEEAFKSNEMATIANAIRHNMIVAKQQAETLAHDSKCRDRAMAIFSKLVSGCKVSKADLQFLKEYSPELYRLALQLAMMAEQQQKQDEKHYSIKYKEISNQETSEDYTKQLEELANTFTETTLEVSFENGVSFGEVSTVTSEY